jgi:glycosyltransferase involved in cell wall biosynthesis
MLEAMSTGCALVLSDTEPVLEFAGPDEAALVSMRDPGAIARAVVELLACDANGQERRRTARDRVRASVAQEASFRRKEELFASLGAGQASKRTLA